MPIVIPKDIPAFPVLKKENVFVMAKKRAESQDIRPIEIAVVNLMPTKVETETQLMRLLANTPLQVNLTLVKLQPTRLLTFLATIWKGFIRPLTKSRMPNLTA